MKVVRIIESIHQEIESRKLVVTAQYLDFHKAAFENGRPKVVNIVHEAPGEYCVVYVPVEGQRFHFAFTLSESTSEVIGLHIEPYHRVYFRAISTELDLNSLKSLVNIVPTECWNQGDFMPNGKHKYAFSAIHFELMLEPDSFERKLVHLLDLLESDVDGIQVLVEQAGGYIQVASYFHLGNGMLGGHALSGELVQRMAALGVGIDFDLYVEGNALA